MRKARLTSFICVLPFLACARGGFKGSHPRFVLFGFAIVFIWWAIANIDDWFKKNK